MEVRNTGCDALLERRLEAKMRANKKVRPLAVFESCGILFLYPYRSETLSTD
jgi:hypothetical protein